MVANIENLQPVRSEEEARELGRKGGIASGKARKARKDRQERIKELFSLAITDPKLKQSLEKLGIKADSMDIETAMDARQALKAMRDGDTNAYKTMKNEAYGPMAERQEVELSGEINGININVRRFDNGKGEA